MDGIKITQKSYKPYAMTIMVILCALVASILRQLSTDRLPVMIRSLCFILRPTIYIALYTVWAVSLYRRIGHRPVRKLLLWMVSLLIFWIALRTVKYFLPDQFTTAIRYCWYLYYLPIVMIPTLTLRLALYMRRPEDYRPPRWTDSIYVIGILCAVLPLFNDWHQWFFTFPSIPWSDLAYTYRPGFYLISGWCILSVVIFLSMIFYKCRVPKSHRLLPLPFVVFYVALLYFILPLVNYAFWEQWMGDITASYCFLFAIFMESCIISGLIPSNTGYEDLFASSSLCAQIVDDQYRTIAASRDASAWDPQAMIRAAQTPYLIEPGLRLCSAPISSGHVLWIDDISQWQQSLEKLKETTSLLEGAHQIEQENMEVKKRKAHLQVKEVLYKNIEQKMRPALETMVSYLTAYEKADTPEEKKDCLSRAILTGAYIKRRTNLLVMEHKSSRILVKELDLCILESLRQLGLMDVISAYRSTAKGALDLAQAVRVYDFYQDLIKSSFGTLAAISIKLTEHDEKLNLLLLVETQADLSPVCRAYGALGEQDFDDSWLIRLIFSRGGDPA